MNFAEAQQRYWELKERYEAGFLRPKQFQAQVEELVVQDEQGRWWMIGVESGKWYVSQEGQWVEAQPPSAPVEKTAPQAAPPVEPPAREVIGDETAPPAVEPLLVPRQPPPAAPTRPAQPLPPVYAPPPPAKAAPGGRWLLFLALGGLGIVVIVIAAALLYFVTRTPKPTPSPGAVAQASETATATAHVVGTTTPTPEMPTTPTPTFQPLVKATSPAVKVTEPPLALPSPELTADVETAVYSGPGTNYDLLGSLPAGETAMVSGRNDEGSWWRIVYPPGPGAHGWVSAADVTPNEDAAGVPVVAPPATPTGVPPAGPTGTPTRPKPKVQPSGGLSGKLAFSLLQNVQYKVYVVQLPDKTYIASVGNARQPSLRSDGERLAVNGSGGGGMETIWTMSPEGTEAREATCYNGNSHPFWSPDGSRLVFDDAELDPRGGRIYIQKVEERNCELHKYPLVAVGTPLQEIVGGGGSYLFPLWTADDRIIFRGCDTWAGTGGVNCGLWAVNPDGSDPAQVTTNPQHTPTDTKGGIVAFMSPESGNWEIYTVSLAGGEPRRLTDNKAMDGLPTISPDGRQIAFISDREGQWAVWVMGVDGSNQQKLMDFNPDMGAVDKDSWTLERMSWSP
jgi:uncharacterized protein YraI